MANQPFVISAEGVDYDIHQVLKETGIEPDIRFSSMDDHVVISMVANNLGISMLPNLVIGNARAQIQALPLEPNFSRELGIGIRSYAGLSPAAQQFIAAIQEHINTFLIQSTCDSLGIFLFRIGISILISPGTITIVGIAYTV